MKVFLAYSGLGTRMGDLHKFLPKSMYPYKGYPIIGHLINFYKDYADQIIVSVGGDSKGKLLRGWLQDYYKNDDWLKIHFQEYATGTTDLLNSAKLVGEEVLVSWSDFVFNDSHLNQLNFDSTVFGVADIDKLATKESICLIFSASVASVSNCN